MMMMGITVMINIIIIVIIIIIMMITAMIIITLFSQMVEWLHSQLEGQMDKGGDDNDHFKDNLNLNMMLIITI